MNTKILITMMVMMKIKRRWNNYDDDNDDEKVRKKSRFVAVKEVEKALVEGIWKLVNLVIVNCFMTIVITIIVITSMIIVMNAQEANRNYEEYLAAIGTGPFFYFFLLLFL